MMKFSCSIRSICKSINLFEYNNSLIADVSSCTFNEIINDGLIFDTEYVCSRDPRWTEFINEEILKGRDKDSLLYFFSSIKEISPSYSDIDDRMSYHIFNLSNTYVEKIPDGPWKAGIKSGKIHEFTIFCIANEIQKTDGFNLCSQYKCISRTPNSKGEIKEMGTHRELIELKGLYFNLCSLQGINS